MDKRVLSLLFCVYVLLISGCGRSEYFQDLRNDVLRMKQLASKKKLEPLPPRQLPTPIIYQGDSFRTPFAIADTQSAADTKKIITSPLQAYPVNILRFVGTLTENGIILAYVKTPDNLTYSVRVGDTIGDHGGKVVSIDADRVSVSETEIQPGKPPIQRIMTLQLKDKS